MTVATMPNSIWSDILTIGEFEEGWHFYDTRLRLPEKVRSPLSNPMWDGNLD